MAFWANKDDDDDDDDDAGMQLRQAYVNQRNEIVNLREQLLKRDRHIAQLEEEVQTLRAASSASGHSVSSVA